MLFFIRDVIFRRMRAGVKSIVSTTASAVRLAAALKVPVVSVAVKVRMAAAMVRLEMVRLVILRLDSFQAKA